MKQIVMIFWAVLFIGCGHSELDRGASSVSMRESNSLDSLLSNTKWVIYNSYYNSEVEFAITGFNTPKTFGELDFQLDSVIKLGDTTIIILSPYLNNVRLTGKQIREGYKVGLGYVKNHEMPYFFVDNRARTRLFPQKPYTHLGEKPDSTSLMKYIEDHNASINPWFKTEALKRISSFYKR